MRNLIVTADDVGLHRGMTAGAIRAHREGIVTACSIVANGSAFDDAVARLRDVPSLEVGVHLTLSGETPLTTIHVPRSYIGFLARQPFLRSDAVEGELRAQIERVLASGLSVTHLNGHQHLHALPRVFRIVTRLAREFGIGYIRLPVEARLSGGPMRRLSIGVLRLIASRNRGSNDATIGISEAGHLDATRLIELFDLVRDGVTELVMHPGIGDPELTSRYRWGYGWERETDALCDPSVREALQRHEIVLTKPSAALMSRRRMGRVIR